MRYFILGLLVFCLWASFARWYYVCKIKNHCGQQETTKEIVEVRPKTLYLKEGEKVILSGYEQFAFDNNSIEANLSENNQLFLDTLSAYLVQHPNKNLTLTGYLRHSEKDKISGLFENLGIARADKVRSLLVNRGIDEKRIDLDHKVLIGENLLKPVNFEVYTIPDSYENSEFEKVAYTFSNMTFSDANFKKNSDEFIPGEPLQLYADSVKTYLNLNEDKVLTIIGHTDSDGTDLYNQDLGLRRAKAARAYFESLRINSKIEVLSKGEKSPAAPNDTEENQQKNRRVNFKIE